MKRNIKIEFSLRLIENDMAQTERFPQIRAFLDAHFDREYPKSVEFDENNLKKEYTFRVEGSLSSRKGNLIPPSSSLVITSWAQRTNEFGAPCLMDTGTTHITLGELMASNGKLVKDLDLVLHTTIQIGAREPKGVEKAKLRFTLLKIEDGGIRLLENHLFLKSNIGDLQKSLVEYIKTTVEFEQNMKDTIPGTSQIRCPFDYSESGIEMTGSIPLPAAAYTKYEIPVTNELFWKNAFSRIMIRDNLSVHDFHNLNIDGRARATVLTVVYPVQYLDYISDTVERNNRHWKYQAQLKQGYENFGDALATWSGDCEDLAGAIMQVYDAFINFNFTDKTLLKMQKIAKNYIPMMSLDVVHGAKVADENAPKGAHMNINFLSIDYVRKSLRNNEKGRYIESKIQWPKKTKSNLPVVIGEGTGMYEPLGYHDDLQEIRRYVYTMRSLQGFKKPITHERGSDSQFFLGSLLGMTNYFFNRGYNIGAFWYGTKSIESNAAPTRGIYYKELANESDKLSFIPQPPIPKQVMDVINEATLLRIPPQPLVLTKKRVTIRNEHLDYIVKDIERLNRPSAPKDQAVPIYIRPHQIDENLAHQIATELRGKNRVWKVSYELENITDDLYGYRVMIYVN